MWGSGNCQALFGAAASSVRRACLPNLNRYNQHRTDLDKLEWLMLMVHFWFFFTHIWSTELRDRTGESCGEPVLTIDTLPNDVLLEIFAFCVLSPGDQPSRRMGEWKSLVQVCKRWQETIYASPRYLDLSLYLSNGDSVAETLSRWPELPLILGYSVSDKRDENLYNTLAQRDRICRIHLFMTRPEAAWIAQPMEQQFPHLTNLALIGMPKYDSDDMPYISLDQFLGGSAPSLQYLRIDDFEYEGLPSLLSSAPNLISLKIDCIRSTCYVSPEVMVGALAGLTELRDLSISFSPGFPTYLFQENKKRRSLHSPSLDRVIFPALTKFQIGGDSEYLEDFVALIDAPRLEDLHVMYVKDYEGFDSEGEIEARNLSQFIGRTSTFKHAQFRRAKVTLCHTTGVEFDLPQGECPQARRISLKFLDKVMYEDDPNTPFLATDLDMIYVLGQLAIMLSDVQHLSIKVIGSPRDEDYILESGQLGVVWFPLLRSFTVVDVLHVSWKLVGSIALAINGAPESMVTQVLPALQILWLDDQDTIRKGKLMTSAKQFLYSRKQSGRPVVIVNSHDQLVQRRNPH